MTWHMENSHVALLNRRLGEGLGFISGRNEPRFAWKYAPDQPWFVYDRDNRTLVKKCWADFPAPDGQPLGPVWVLAGWQRSRAVDHFGFSNGLRVPLIREWDYLPYFETALVRGATPSEALTQNYIREIDQQLQRSVEHDPDWFNNYMAEEKYSADRNRERDRNAWLESARESYDNNVGAFGNCEPGKRHGYLSFMNNESSNTQEGSQV